MNLCISAVLRHCDAYLLGVIIVAVGGYHVYKAASRNFLDDLKGNSSDLSDDWARSVTSPTAW
jgi:hypothetical protein